MREFPLALPARMRELPVDKRGYPVPRFVEWLDGQPDFRVVDVEHMGRCIRQRRCWICGEVLGGTFVFVVGPMSAINRINSEPPSHYECAMFAAVACPFLSQPLARRNERDLPDKVVDPAGIALPHNPTACCLWVTKSYQIERVGSGVLFQLGEPLRLEFYHRGRPATKAEVEASVAIGLPKLEQAARAEGGRAMEALMLRLNGFRNLLSRQQWPAEEVVP